MGKQPVISFLLCTVCLLLMRCGTVAQKPPANYRERAARLHRNIYTFFYDSTAQLFKEAKEREKNDKDFSYLWPLCALIQAANEMETLEPGKEYMQVVLKAIEQYHSTRIPAPGYEAYPVQYGGDARFYDDNQWIGIALIDAYARTGRQAYLDQAAGIYRFMITGYSTIAGGGLYWKEGDFTTKNTCSNGPGIVLALKLYKATKEQQYLDTALSLYQWTNRHLRSPQGIYYDHIKLPSLEVDKRFYTYNAGTMLESNVLLYEITGDKKYLSEAQLLAKACIEQFYKNGRLPEHYWFNAVLLRGYAALYRQDANRTYINAMQHDAEEVWVNEADENKLLGKHKRKELIFQAAMMEIYARLAMMK